MTTIGRAVQLRRALLLFAMVVFLSAAAASLVEPPPPEGEGETTAATAPPGGAADTKARPDPRAAKSAAGAERPRGERGERGQRERPPSGRPAGSGRRLDAPSPGAPIEVEFRAGGTSPEHPAARTIRVAQGAHLIVTVTAQTPGQAELEGLGRLAQLEPGTPAVFDLLADRTGRFDAVFTPVGGRARRAGTIVVESASSASGS